MISTLATLTAIGIALGRIAAVWSAGLMPPEVKSGLTRCRQCNAVQPWSRIWLTWYPRVRCQTCQFRDVRWPLWSSLSLGCFFAVFGWLLLSQNCQSVSEVQPSRSLWVNRLPFHLAFIFLLATATITDYLDYVIPDQIVLPGILLALIGATWSGELQMIHVWVDWSYDQQPIPSPVDPNEFVLHYGPYLPEWMKHHQHIHGFIWSLSGLLTGAGLMWLARVAANVILGVPAIGFGDVTLMAMIGAFMGWQPTLCALAIAPLVGIVLGLGGRIITGRSFVAFGPYLCFGAFIVLCSWRILWQDLGLRIIFSHWQSISGLVGGSFITFCILLVALRFFKATPASRLKH